VVRTGNLIDVVEAKALSRVGHSHLKRWLIKRTDPTGKTVYEFNGEALAKYLRRNDRDLSNLLRNGHQFRYHLFVYDPSPGLSSELMELFGASARIPIKEFPGNEIILTWTRHWDS
jgi:hypothetical protein